MKWIEKTNKRPVILICGGEEVKASRDIFKGIIPFFAKFKNFLYTRKEFQIFSVNSYQQEVFISDISKVLMNAREYIKYNYLGYEKPLVIVLAHGSTDFKFGSNELFHTLEISYIRGNSYFKSIFTDFLFSIIGIYIEKPVELVLASCLSGAANNVASYLPPESSLYSLTDEKSNVFTDILWRGVQYLECREKLSTMDIVLSTFLGLKGRAFDLGKLKIINNLQEAQLPHLSEFIYGKLGKFYLDELLKICTDYEKFGFCSKTKNLLIEGRSPEYIKQFYKTIVDNITYDYNFKDKICITWGAQTSHQQTKKLGILDVALALMADDEIALHYLFSFRVIGGLKVDSLMYSIMCSLYYDNFEKFYEPVKKSGTYKNDKNSSGITVTMMKSFVNQYVEVFKETEFVGDTDEDQEYFF